MRARSLLPVLLIGCGGRDGPGAVTTVDGNKRLDTLSTADAGKLCDDALAYYARQMSLVNECRYGAYFFVAVEVRDPSLTDAQLRADCAREYDGCVAAGPGTPVLSCGTPPPTFPAPCTATVAQYSACVADWASTLNETNAATPACSAVTRAVIAAYGTPGLTQPESCRTFGSACPTGIVPLP